MRLEFEMPKMREKLSSLLFLLLLFSAAILLCSQFVESMLGVGKDENVDDYVAFGSVFISAFSAMIIILHNYNGIAME